VTDIDGCHLEEEAQRWVAAAAQALREGDPSAHVWRKTAKRAVRELEIFQAGVRAGKEKR
jgi:hypothetical protein